MTPLPTSLPAIRIDPDGSWHRLRFGSFAAGDPQYDPYEPSAEERAREAARRAPVAVVQLVLFEVEDKAA